MNRLKLKKGDEVLVIAGKEKGKRGKILHALPKIGKVVVEGLHLIKKHRRPKRSGEKGESVLIPQPIPVSKVKLICPKCGAATRVGHKLVGENKYRMCKKCGSEI